MPATYVYMESEGLQIGEVSFYWLSPKAEIDLVSKRKGQGVGGLGKFGNLACPGSLSTNTLDLVLSKGFIPLAAKPLVSQCKSF